MVRVPREVAGYKVGAKIGSGSFGDVYSGRGRNGEEVAIKLEKPSKDRAQLLHEWKLYSSLAGGVGIPRVYWFGVAGKFNALVMELLGPSLEDLFKRQDKRFSPKTVMMLADQMIQQLQFVHSRGIVHRDIKPNNFLIGRGNNARQIYIVDFGLSKTYLSKTGQHVSYKDGRTGLTGTARYTSISNHQGIELARRDDMEGLGYVLVRMLTGTLPWQGIKAETKPKRNELIKVKKIETTLEELCTGLPGGCDREFVEYIATCRNLGFYDVPPYDAFRGLFRSVLARGNHENDMVFDWSDEKDEDMSTSYSSKNSGGSEASRSAGGRKRALSDPERAQRVPTRKRSKLATKG